MAIARAGQRPTVVLADEPTANLDSAIGRQVARRLEEIADRCCGWRTAPSAELATMATDPVCGMTVAQHDGPYLQLDGTMC